MTALKFPPLSLWLQRVCVCVCESECVCLRDRRPHITVFTDESRKKKVPPPPQGYTKDHDFQELLAFFFFTFSPKEFSCWCLTLSRSSCAQVRAAFHNVMLPTRFCNGMLTSKEEDSREFSSSLNDVSCLFCCELLTHFWMDKQLQPSPQGDVPFVSRHL